MQSFFGRVNYSLDNKYLLTASIRADGSTKFGENNKYGYFPSAAFAWKVINESFMANAPWLSDLKLRVGWGQTGNQEIPNKATQNSFRLDENGAITQTRVGNPDLQWEVSTQFNVGLDYGLLQGKVYGNIDYFRKVNTDQLLLVAAADPSVSEIWVNLDGDITNTGLEVLIGYQAVETADLSWTVDFNATFTDNQINFPDNSQYLTGSLSGQGLNGTFVQIITDGVEVGSFYLKEDQGDGSTTTQETVVGSAIPDFIYGFNSYLRYRQFDMSLNFSGVAGNKIYNNTANFFNNLNLLANGTNVTRELFESGDQVPSGASTYYLEDGGYLRLNNLTLGYNLNVDGISWLGRARVYLTGQNLFVITDYTGYDPEVDTPKAVGGNLSYGIDYGAYPRARTFLLGLNVTF